MNTIQILKTINYRGIECIDTFPVELIWSKSGTVLECSNCLTYATFKNILVGLCKNCAMYSYNYKYGSGFYKYPYSNIFNNEIELCFGNIHPLNILHIEGVEYPQAALKCENTYSIYNLSLSSKNELALLLQEPFNIYSINDFQKYYNCNIDILDMIINKVVEHRISFNIWSNDYYNKCLDIEKFFKVSKEDYEIQVNINTINNNKYKCYYCNVYKFKHELKKCSNCYSLRYCSIACQARDWIEHHKLECKQQEQEQDLENPARKEQDLENPARKAAFKKSRAKTDDESGDDDDDDGYDYDNDDGDDDGDDGDDDDDGNDDDDDGDDSSTNLSYYLNIDDTEYDN